MVKTGIGTDELKKPKFWQIAAGEIIGTLFVVLFTSLVVNRHDGKSVIMTISLVSGLVYSIVLFTFGNHGYFNPAITISLFCAQRIPLVRMGVFVASQLFGAISAQVLASYVLLNSWYSSMGPGATMPHNDVNLIQLFSVEFFGSAVISAIISTKCSALVIGLTISTITAAMFPFEMGCFNPARGIASNIVAGKVTSYCWVYWLAPTFGAIAARLMMVAVDKMKIEPDDIERTQNRMLGDHSD